MLAQHRRISLCLKVLHALAVCMLTVHHSLALADTTRNMRSTMTMMKYLARTSSEGELNKVLSQNARVEGSLAERRRREGKLRSDQEELEEKMTQGMHSLAMTLQADAHQKALVKARQAQQSRQANAAAEQAARVMGAVAPHRAAARDVALESSRPRSRGRPSPWARTQICSAAAEGRRT